jgi:hypothetical protein
MITAYERYAYYLRSGNAISVYARLYAPPNEPKESERPPCSNKQERQYVADRCPLFKAVYGSPLQAGPPPQKYRLIIVSLYDTIIPFMKIPLRRFS